MATERLSMRHTREILRQKLTLSRSHRAIAQSLGLSSGTVGATVLRARAAGLDWPQVEALTDDALEGRLYGLRAVAGSRSRPWPDCAALHAERRKPGVTLELLHLEYLEDRYGDRSTTITSQLPPAQWHDYLADATLADAICDRILHNAHRLVLKGPSRRKEAKLDD
jgi:hypothetical protein